MNGTFSGGKELKTISLLKDLWDREDSGISDSYSKAGKEGAGRREEQLVLTCSFSFGKRTSGEDSVQAA